MKHITTALFAVLIIMTTRTQSFAQMGLGKPDDVAAIKGRTLIVIVEKPDQKVIDKLNKKGKSEYIDDYKKAVDDYNTNLKDAVDKYWTFSKNVEYKTDDEAEEYIKQGSRNYAVLRCETIATGAGGLNVSRGLRWTYTDFK